MMNILELEDDMFPEPGYVYSEQEKEYLRPIAETLAMLDGNAFFGIEVKGYEHYEHYEQYLPEAFALFNANGGLHGNAGQASFVLKTQSKYRTQKILGLLSFYTKKASEVFLFFAIGMIALLIGLNLCSWVLAGFLQVIS